MEIRFLGTGTSQGVPMIACNCNVCRSPDPRNHRYRTSAHIEMDGYHIQVDAGPEFRLQCLANDIQWVDIVILTHEHADHLLGMDDLRRFCDLREGANLPVYSTPKGLERVAATYPYAIFDRPLVRGYPAFSLHEMPRVLETPGGSVQSVRLPHGVTDVLGLIFKEKSSGHTIAYFTDCKEIPAAARELARDADIVVLDALRPQPHPSHMSIHEAIETALEIDAPQTYFIHMTHAIEHEVWEKKLPPKINLAYDGLKVSLDSTSES